MLKLFKMINLKNHPTKATNGQDQAEILEELGTLQSRLFKLQRLLYANSERSLLIILQGLDASGKQRHQASLLLCQSYGL